MRSHLDNEVPLLPARGPGGGGPVLVQDGDRQAGAVRQPLARVRVVGAKAVSDGESLLLKMKPPLSKDTSIVKKSGKKLRCPGNSSKSKNQW